MFQWRRFQFFEKELVKEEGSAAPHPVLQGIDVTCATSGRGHLVFGDADGVVNIVDREFNLTHFQAYDLRVTHAHQLKQRNILFTIGDDRDQPPSTLKIWKLDLMDDKGVPQCLSSRPIFSSRVPQVPVTCFTVSEDVTQLALGLANGQVILYKGDILRDRAKQKLLATDTPDPVTGVAFAEATRHHPMSLFVTTTMSVTTFYTTQRNETHMAVDERGCELGCAVLSDDGYMVLGRSEAVYFYARDGRGPCFGFEGHKKMLGWFRGYLVVVSVDKNNPAVNLLSVHDLKNKFTAFTTPLPDVQHLVFEWGAVYVVVGNGKVFQLTEKDTQTKLEMLFKKNLYSIAINLANSQQFDNAAIIDIFRKYGDHLYGKGDYDGAIVQYLKTIGTLEPSYVIRKFLDAQRILNLTRYLQALHEQNLANADHTTLLLNCYTKLKDVSKLYEFIKDEELHFEVETAIKVCRQAGYHEHALYLAKRHHEHDWYLKIQLEDLHHYDDALEYINTLPFLEAEKNVKKYGKILVEHMPEQTTALLMQLCTNYQAKGGLAAAPTHTSAAGGGSGGGGGGSGVAGGDDDELPPMATLDLGDLDDERAALFGPSGGGGGGGGAGSDTIDDLLRSDSFVSDEGPPRTKALPEEFIHIYVDQPNWLMVFLEFMVQQEPDSSALVYNTLLELYLREGETALMAGDEKTSKARGAKALELLHNPTAKYESDQALVLVRMHEFFPGMMFLYEKLMLYNEILSHYVEAEDHGEVIATCKKFGEKDPNLWVTALRYFAGKGDDVASELMEAIHHIDRGNLLPPLLVVQILAANPTTPLAVVKPYITRRLQVERQHIEEDQRSIREYREQTRKMREEIHELRTSARIFQLSKCVACSSTLDLPAVHFLCMHSFHQRCVGDNERECPKCAPENQRVSEKRAMLEQKSTEHDDFFKQLDEADDGFTKVAEYFGRGLFHEVEIVGGGGGDFGGDFGGGGGAHDLPDDPDMQRDMLFQ